MVFKICRGCGVAMVIPFVLQPLMALYVWQNPMYRPYSCCSTLLDLYVWQPPKCWSLWCGSTPLVSTPFLLQHLVSSVRVPTPNVSIPSCGSTLLVLYVWQHPVLIPFVWQDPMCPFHNPLIGFLRVAGPHVLVRPSTWNGIERVFLKTASQGTQIMMRTSYCFIVQINSGQSLFLARPKNDSFVTNFWFVQANYLKRL